MIPSTLTTLQSGIHGTIGAVYGPHRAHWPLDPPSIVPVISPVRAPAAIAQRRCACGHRPGAGRPSPNCTRSRSGSLSVPDIMSLI